MRGAIRSIKNNVKKYDNGQRMIKAITADSEEIPTDAALRELTVYCRNDMGSTPTYDVLFERVKDYLRLRHVEKALLVVEHLLRHGTKKFVRICTAETDEFTKLTTYVYKVDGSDIGQNVRRRAKVILELLQRDDIQNKTNTWDDAKQYGSPSKDISSYDDYFGAADREDRNKRMKNETTATSESELIKKKKKKKKKKSKNKEFEKQKSAAFSSGDEMEDNHDAFSDQDSDPFPATLSTSKPKKSKKKTKPKKKAEEEDDFGFGSLGDDNDDFFGNANADKANATVVPSEDVFSTTSSNDDPFWKSNTTQNSNDESVVPNNPSSEVKKETVDVNKGGDDLMDFFSSPSPTNNVQQPTQNGFVAQPQQSNDPFASFGGGNGNNDAFFSSTAAPNTNVNANMNGNVFGNNGFSQNQMMQNGFGNQNMQMQQSNGFGNNNTMYNANQQNMNGYVQPVVQNNNAMNGFANGGGNPFGNNGFQQQQVQNNPFGNNNFGTNGYQNNTNMNNGFGANTQSNAQSDPFGGLMSF